jgi:arsenate reductase
VAAVNTLLGSIDLQRVNELPIAQERVERLQKLADYLALGLSQKGEIHLNFICTHNSRRSHLAQIWAQVMAHHHQVEGVYCYSAGTEQTELNSQIVATLKKQGFLITQMEQGENPKYQISYSQFAPTILAYSKTIKQQNIPQPFAAVMTCSDADENCPFIPGSQKRIALNYEDPKAFDGTPLAAKKYLERSLQIASEMNWVFEQIKIHQ